MKSVEPVLTKQRKNEAQCQKVTITTQNTPIQDDCQMFVHLYIPFNEVNIARDNYSIAVDNALIIDWGSNID